MFKYADNKALLVINKHQITGSYNLWGHSRDSNCIQTNCKKKNARSGIYVNTTTSIMIFMKIYLYR